MFALIDALIDVYIGADQHVTLIFRFRGSGGPYIGVLPAATVTRPTQIRNQMPLRDAQNQLLTGWSGRFSLAGNDAGPVTSPVCTPRRAK
jgi:hypothetical protein